MTDRDGEDRPDPDALLRRMQAEEARAKRGKLKIFFGLAPGVGKTYRMLQVARDLVCEQHLDVVIGLVESHRRPDTASMVLGLELLPRRRVEYRGHVLEEFDLDLALARRPALLLLDELAHTNAPGGRHAKRWQDVEELLAAGIDVFTTVNVQHVESLNDVVAQIAGVQVRETVPDAVLDRADAIELVDIAPEELLQRLREGKVYLPDQASRAVEHFFKRGNLLALRELALRRTAQHVDEDVLAYREAHGVRATWPTGERILVCVGPAPSSGRLIRAAARLAAGLRCPWTATYVEPTVGAPLTDADRDRLEVHLRLAESLGASVGRLSGDHVAKTLVDHARRSNVTRIVLGKPRHSRWRDRLRGSLVDDVVRESGEIEVQVIGGGDDGRPTPAGPAAPASRSGAPVWQHFAAAGLVGATLLLALGLRSALGLPDLEMLFLLAVMAIAARFSRAPALTAATLSVAAYDFFFVPPLYTFSVGDRRYWLTFLMMFGVGLAMSELVGRLRRQERESSAREARTAALYGLTRALGAVERPEEIAAVAARHAADAFRAAVVLLTNGDDGEPAPTAAYPEGTSLAPGDLGVARWALANDAPSGLGTDRLPGAPVVCMPLRAGAARPGVLALRPLDGAPLRADQRAFLDVYCRQVAVAQERARLVEAAHSAALRARTEEMRASLLSTVSHDLRTPLASITGAATALRDSPGLDAETRAGLVDAIVDQAERLERLVANLLDMTRLEAGALTLSPDWVPVEELFGSALTRLEGALAGRPVRIDVPGDVPLLRVDPVVFEHVFVNLLENAVKYTPPGTPIELRARFEGGASPAVHMEVADHGPGLVVGEEARIFEKFVRGGARQGTGAGLGLAICRGIVEAHGGSITAANRAAHPPGSGAVFRVVLPVRGAPPPMPPALEASS